jgi:hypothetical protein
MNAGKVLLCDKLPLCYGAEDRNAGLYALDGKPRAVEQAVDRMQYYVHSRQTKSSKPSRDVRQVGPLGCSPARGIARVKEAGQRIGKATQGPKRAQEAGQ